MDHPNWFVSSGLKFSGVMVASSRKRLSKHFEGDRQLPVLYMMGSGTAIELRTVLLFFLTRKFSPPSLSLSLSLSLTPPPPNWNLETRETVAV